MRHLPGDTLRNNFTSHAAEGARIKTFRENGSIFPDSVKTPQDDAPFFRYAPTDRCRICRIYGHLCPISALKCVFL